jgi:hypothetical protein
LVIARALGASSYTLAIGSALLAFSPGAHASSQAAELPDNIHIYIDLLRRVTGFTVPKMKRLLGGLNSLGFTCSVRDSHDDDADKAKRLGTSPLFEVEWSDLMAGNEYLEMLVAFEMIHGATEGYCEEHGIAALRRLDFSQLATATKSEDTHTSPRRRTATGKTRTPAKKRAARTSNRSRPRPKRAR